MVLTLASPFSIVVPRDVSVTYSHKAGTEGIPSISTRRKTIPVLSSAGITVILTCTPVCRPLPSNEIGEARVLCFVAITYNFSLLLTIFVIYATNIIKLLKKLLFLL
jgi:hypothetical protein